MNKSVRKREKKENRIKLIIIKYLENKDKIIIIYDNVNLKN